MAVHGTGGRCSVDCGVAGILCGVSDFLSGKVLVAFLGFGERGGRYEIDTNENSFIDYDWNHCFCAGYWRCWNYKF